MVGDGNLDSNVVVARMTGGVEWGRPLSTGWTGTLGINWQRARCLDDKGRPLLQVIVVPSFEPGKSERSSN